MAAVKVAQRGMGMTKRDIFGLLSLLLLLTMPKVASTANWQWMTPERVMNLTKEGSGLWLIDVRSETVFAGGHIEGAINIPAGLLAAKSLPKGKIMILADDSLGLRRGREAAELLLKKGHDKVFLLKGGMPAWQGERYPMAAKGTGPTIPSVMPDDVVWALEHGIQVIILDLRDKGEREQGAVPQAQAVEGKNQAERLAQVKEMIGRGEKKGLAAQLDMPPTVILVLPSGADPRTFLDRSFRGVTADLRYMEGGYAAWAAGPEKNITIVGACPTCPGRTSGGIKP